MKQSTEFKHGDKVYHLTNDIQVLLVKAVTGLRSQDGDRQMVFCEWIDSAGVPHEAEYDSAHIRRK